MIETEFMKLYEELGQLNEKWHTLEDYDARIWFSDSAVAFKNFMRNLPSSGFKGVRLCVAPDFYLVSNAEDLSHDAMEEVAEEALYLEVPDTERVTCGIPKCTDFELGNYEIAELTQAAQDYPDDDFYDEYRNYDVEKDYQGMLIADYGTFELSLYNFKSKTCPEYTPSYKYATYFEDSEIYRVLKPMLKRIYIYGN